MKRLGLADFSSRLEPLDAVFIWNCFEQLDDPRRALRESRRLLRRNGRIVLRVPNGEFYRRQIPSDPDGLVRLGYNNLLGFPYLSGYSLGSLKRLLRSLNFEPEAAFATHLLTPPYPRMSVQMAEEWRILEIEAEHAAPNASPWIEIVARVSNPPGI